jgi:hypothetical protein
MKTNIMLFFLMFTSIQTLFGQRSKMPVGTIYAKDKIIHSGDTISLKEAETICCLGVGGYHQKGYYITCEVFTFDFLLTEPGFDTTYMTANRPTLTTHMQKRIRNIKQFAYLDFNFIRASCEDNYQLESPSYIRIYIKP